MSWLIMGALRRRRGKQCTPRSSKGWEKQQEFRKRPSSRLLQATGRNFHKGGKKKTSYHASRSLAHHRTPLTFRVAACRVSIHRRNRVRLFRLPGQPTLGFSCDVQGFVLQALFQRCLYRRGRIRLPPANTGPEGRFHRHLWKYSRTHHQKAWLGASRLRASGRFNLRAGPTAPHSQHYRLFLRVTALRKPRLSTRLTWLSSTGVRDLMTLPAVCAVTLLLRVVVVSPVYGTYP